MLNGPRRQRTLYEEAAQLTDVLKQRTVPGHDIVPEAGPGETLSQKDRAAIHECRANGHHTSDAVVHGQTVVHPIRGPGVDESGEPVAPLHQTIVTDVSGFG